MWRPIKKSSGKRIDTLLSDDEKKVWETHPTTRRIYTFVFEKEPEKPKIDPPIEARDFKKVAAPETAANPKKPKKDNEHKT